MATRGSGGIPLMAYVAVGTLALLYFKSSLGLIGLAYLIESNPLPWPSSWPSSVSPAWAVEPLTPQPELKWTPKTGQ